MVDATPLYLTTPVATSPCATAAAGADVMAGVTSLVYVVTGEEVYTPLLRLQGAVYLMLALLGASANAYLVLCVLRKQRFRRQFANFLLLHMGVVQLVYCVLVLAPYGALLLVLDLLGGGGGAVVLLEGRACRGLGSLGCATTLLSLWSLVALNMHKYRTITRPLRHSTFATRQRLWLFLSLAWTVAAIFVLGVNLGGPTFTYDPYLGGCALGYWRQGGRSNALALVVLSATFLLPTALLCLVYARLFYIARTHRLHIVSLLHRLAFQVQVPATPRLSRPSSFVQVYALAGDRKAAGSILLIMGTFALCYIPFVTLSMYEAAARCRPHPALLMAAMLAFRAHPLVNALVYGVHNKVLRRRACRRRALDAETGLRPSKGLRRAHTVHECYQRPRFEI